MNRFFFRSLFSAAFLVAAPTVGAITIGQVDDFEDGTTQGWAIGNPSLPEAPANASGRLQLSTNGNGGASGANLIAFNTDQWAGDYLGAGVTAITLDVSNPNNADLNLRLGISGNAGSFVTEDILVAAGAELTAVRFDLTAANLIDLTDSGGLGDLLTDVRELRLLHNPLARSGSSGAAVGAPVGSPPVAATVLFDNLTAIPEPASLLTAAVGCVLVSAPRRRRA